MVMATALATKTTELFVDICFGTSFDLCCSWLQVLIIHMFFDMATEFARYLIQSLLVVGSQLHGSYRPLGVSSSSISSALSSKSYTFAFSSMRLGVTLFGSGMKPFCKLHRTNICAQVLPYFSLIFFSTRSDARSPRTSGQYASITTFRCRHQPTISSLGSQGCSSHWPTSIVPPTPLSLMYASSSSR